MSRGSMKRLWSEFTGVLRGILDELTDRNAYRRHLTAHGAVDSPDEWRRFQDHLWASRQRRGRCC